MDELQEALKDLRDIHEPDPVSFWPLAPGWWIVLLIIIFSVFLLRWWLKRDKSPRYKKLANEELKNITTNYEVQRNGHKTAGEVSELIRKIMILTDNRAEVAGMIDEEWLAYLDEKSGTELFTKGAGRILTTAVYQKESDIDVDGLLAATRALLKNV